MVFEVVFTISRYKNVARKLLKIETTCESVFRVYVYLILCLIQAKVHTANRIDDRKTPHNYTVTWSASVHLPNQSICFNQSQRKPCYIFKLLWITLVASMHYFPKGKQRFHLTLSCEQNQILPPSYVALSIKSLCLHGAPLLPRTLIGKKIQTKWTFPSNPIQLF